MPPAPTVTRPLPQPRLGSGGIGRALAWVLTGWLLTSGLLAGAARAQAPEPQPALPEAPWGWQAPNPWRSTGPGDATVLAQGRQAYDEHCARCHGEQASRPQAEAPDLRRLNGFCRPLNNPALQAHCQRDVDAYFSQSVQEGKVRAGVVHMPPWAGVISPASAWAIQRFIESRPLPAPRTQTSVDLAR